MRTMSLSSASMILMRKSCSLLSKLRSLSSLNLTGTSTASSKNCMTLTISPLLNPQYTQCWTKPLLPRPPPTMQNESASRPKPMHLKPNLMVLRLDFQRHRPPLRKSRTLMWRAALLTPCFNFTRVTKAGSMPSSDMRLNSQRIKQVSGSESQASQSLVSKEFCKDIIPQIILLREKLSEIFEAKTSRIMQKILECQSWPITRRRRILLAPSLIRLTSWLRTSTP